MGQKGGVQLTSFSSKKEGERVILGKKGGLDFFYQGGGTS